MADRIAERIWARIDTSAGPDACWPWMGHRTVDGYGRTEINHRAWRVTRWIITQLDAPLEPGEVVRHTCDNPPCCNPRHLLRGTHADNMRDRAERARGETGDAHWTRLHPERLYRGERNPAASLTEDDVREIRRRYAEGELQSVLAEEFHVTQGHVSNIVLFRKWIHLKE
jgi:hypothetical protein